MSAGNATLPLAQAEVGRPPFWVRAALRSHWLSPKGQCCALRRPPRIRPLRGIVPQFSSSAPSLRPLCPPPTLHGHSLFPQCLFRASPHPPLCHLPASPPHTPPHIPPSCPPQCPNVPPCAHRPLPVSPNPAPRPLPASPPHCPHRVPSLPPSFLSAPHPRTSPTSPPVPVCIFQEGAPTALWGQRDVVPRATPRALCTRCPQTAAMFPMVGGCDAVTPWPRVSDKGGQRPLTPWVAAVIGVKGGGQHPPRTLPSTHTLKWDHGERAAVGLGGSWGGTVTPICQHHPSPTCHHGVTGLGPHGVGPPAAGLRWGYSSPPVTLTPMVFTQAQPPSTGAGAALGDKRT